KSKVVEHLHGGRVEAVHVREGQMVEKGEVLITLDSQAVKARYDEIHQHYLGIRAAESRLIAEQKGAGRISFHPDVINDPDRLLAARHMQTQSRLFVSRQTTLRLLEEQLGGIRDLVSEGYAPLNQQRDLEMRIAQHKAETATQLAELQLEVDAGAQKVKALAFELENTEIRAPATGQVVGLQVQTVGAVIQPGQKVMDIVPLDETLLVEVKVEPHLIDRIHAGLIADVRFASFANSPQLVVDGNVESVSKDLLTNPQMNPAQPGSSYYLALISITPDGVKKLGGRKMQPGMPVEAVIKTGERSLLTYLLHPLLKRISASLKEE
ncbi:MAG: HlyD family efflux transporter periplasmic adaptor subunit, partial [Chlorobiaceae bacterium]|nr:HlyD family efflux transporter periplasmic adaptor subunit [Chlorobiaceae bacterium]